MAYLLKLSDDFAQYLKCTACLCRGPSSTCTIKQVVNTRKGPVRIHPEVLA